MPFIPPNPNATCTCGMDTSTDGYRFDVVCPKHYGICRITIAATHTTAPLVKPERREAIQSFRNALARICEAYGVKLKGDTDASGDILVYDLKTTLPHGYEWSAYIEPGGQLEFCDYVLEDECGATKQ